MTEPPQPIPQAALPKTDADLVDWIRLIRSPRVGATTFRRLVVEHGSVSAAIGALPRLAADAGVDRYHPCAVAQADAELAAARNAGAAPLLLGHPDYPTLLATVSDAPPLLWALGDPALGRSRTIAMVGARNASALGLRTATRLATDLAPAVSRSRPALRAASTGRSTRRP